LLHKAEDQEKSYSFKFRSIEKDLSQLSVRTNYSSKESDILGKDGKELWNFNQIELKGSKGIVNLDGIFDTSQGIITGADKVTKRHINKGYIDESYFKRGIFILKQDVDYRIINSEYKLKINNTWRGLNQEDLKFIKPFVKTENIYKWGVANSNVKLLYVGKNELSENVKQYLKQFRQVLINRSTTVSNDRIITLKEFDNYNRKDIKNNYSSAGAVQKVMRSKKWYLPFYERKAIPFDSVKIIFNTKNMDIFCFSDSPAYSTGGGGGGQTFIYPNESNFWEEVKLKSSVRDYLIFTNAILNSKVIQTYISSANYNQLSTRKIGEVPIPKINFLNANELTIYKIILREVKKIIKNKGNEEKLDTYIYKLYNLSWEEAKVIDPEFELSEEEYNSVKLNINTAETV
jgi:hypothetical protein